MAPITELYETSGWVSGSTSKTSSSVSVTAGDTLVVLAATQDAAATLATPTNSGTALTWTLQRTDATSNYSAVYLWTATADSTRSLTVTVTRAGSNYAWGFVLLSASGGAGIGNTVVAKASGSLPSASITASANSAVAALVADWNATSGTVTWSAINVSATADANTLVSSAARFTVAHWTDVGSAGSKTVAQSAPSGQKWSLVAIELLAATPVSTTDTGNLSASSETSTVAVVISVATSDTGTLSASETSTVAAVLARTDAGTLAATDTSSLAASSSTNDTGNLSASETSTLSIATVAARSDTNTLTATETASVRRATSRADLVRPWDAPSRDTWPLTTRTRLWDRAVDDRCRTLAGWGELVDLAGRPIQIMTDTSRPSWRLPLAAAQISYNCEQPASWSARLSFAHPWLIPTTARHPLWGASAARIRLWWAVWSVEAGTWLTRPVCTLAIGDTDATDTGVISGTITGRDVLSTMVGYGRGAPTVTGMTVDRAIATIIARSAPALQPRIAATTVVVPDGTVLRDPMTDLADLAAIGWPAGMVRSDESGGVWAGPRPTSTDAPLNWQEGPGNPVSQLDWAHQVTAMGNQVTAVSTHPDAVGLVVTRQDDDPTSPTRTSGPWGLHPLKTIESSVAATTDALTAIADAALDAGLHPTEDVKIKIPQRPDLYGWRPARITRAQVGLAAVVQVASWTLTLPVPGGDPGLMDVGMIERPV